MGIYTRTGDKGTSATLAGNRHSKDHGIFEANGTIDELSAHFGVVRTNDELLRSAPRLAAFLERLQKDLIPLGAYVSGGDASYLEAIAIPAKAFEGVIDDILEHHPINEFIIPGANPLEAQLHLLRTVCRRVERRLAAIVDQRPDPGALRHINRLSDLLFALALWCRSPFDLSYP